MSRDPDAPVRFRGMTLRVYRVSLQGDRESLPASTAAVRGGGAYPECSCPRCRASETAAVRQESA